MYLIRTIGHHAISTRAGYHVERIMFFFFFSHYIDLSSFFFFFLMSGPPPRSPLFPYPPLSRSPPAASLETVTITSECWDQVPIYPGSWYDASMVALGRGLVPDAGVFFGPAGLMACRVSTFYVALKPRFDFTAAAPIPASLRRSEDEADTVRSEERRVGKECRS